MLETYTTYAYIPLAHVSVFQRMSDIFHTLAYASTICNSVRAFTFTTTHTRASSSRGRQISASILKFLGIFLEICWRYIEMKIYNPEKILAVTIILLNMSWQPIVTPVRVGSDRYPCKGGVWPHAPFQFPVSFQFPQWSVVVMWI